MRRRTQIRGRAIAALAVLAVLALALFGPRDTRPAAAHHLCGATGSIFGAFDFQTYEAGDSKNTYARALELAGFNQLFPDIPAFALPPLETGDRSASSGQTVDPYIPPVILKAIAVIESNWAMAPSEVPYGSVGLALASHDCGYGIMQVTSGMQNVSGVPTLEQAMIGGHYAFNIARGAQILADKWNMAPEFRPIVGNRDPHLIENWYYTLWGYNGFAFKNHPLNPDYASGRVPYSCGPDGDGYGHDRSQYPYQELVLGCVAHPPVRNGTALWPAQEVHLPELTDAKFAEPLKVDNWNACSYNAQCAPMDIPTPNTNHKDPTTVTTTRAQLIGSPSLDVSADHLSLISVPPAITGAATVTVGNAGSGILAYRATSNVPWLTVSRYQGVALGSDLGGANSDIEIGTDGSGLGPGKYTGQVKIESLYADNAPRVVTVTLQNYPDGALLQGSGPGVYVMKNGLRRGIPNIASFEAYAFSWSDVINVPDATLNRVPEGNLLADVLADGNLLQASGPGVYVMDHGQRRWITSPAALSACGYGWEAVYHFSDASLYQVPEGAEVDGSSCPAGSEPDGSLVRNTAGTVYYLSQGLKRGIPNIATFEARGFLWGNVDQLPDSFIATITNGNLLPDALARGNLLQASGKAVYVMADGVKRLVPSTSIMSGCGYSADAVQKVSDATLNGILTVSDLNGSSCPRLVPPEGSLVRNSAGAVYLMQGGRRRGLPNVLTFELRGLRWGNVDQTPDGVVSAIPDGGLLADAVEDGLLLQASGPAVFVTENGSRRHVASPLMMTVCGYRWEDIRDVSDGALNTLAAGPLLDNPPCP